MRNLHHPITICQERYTNIHLLCDLQPKQFSSPIKRTQNCSNWEEEEHTKYRECYHKQTTQHNSRMQTPHMGQQNGQINQREYLRTKTQKVDQFQRHRLSINQKERKLWELAKEEGSPERKESLGSMVVRKHTASTMLSNKEWKVVEGIERQNPKVWENLMILIDVSEVGCNIVDIK